MTKDEMAGWQHQLNGREFEQAPGISEGQEAWHAAVHGVTKRDRKSTRLNSSDCLSVLILFCQSMGSTEFLSFLHHCKDCKEIQPVHPKGDQSWVFIGRTDAEAETPVLWPPHEKS